MDTRQYYDRKQYVERVKNSFSTSGEKRKSYYAAEDDLGEKEGRSFFKLRFVLALVLFLGFLFIQQANISYQSLNAPNIVKQIKNTISLPESIPKLSEAIHIEQHS